MASAGPRYFGFVIGGTLPAALAANMLAGAWDQNAASGSCRLAATAFLEEVCRRWLVALFGLPPDAGIGFVTGATMANFSALAAARHALLDRSGWDVEAHGLFGAPPITVIVGAEVHVSVLKALGLLGLGRERVVRVAVDGQGRMRPEAIPALTEPAIICVQAGNVNTGAFDPAGGDLRHRPGIGRVGARRRRLRTVGGGVPGPGASGSRDPGARLVGDRRPQVAERALRQRDRLRARPAAPQASMASSAAYLIAGDTREPSHFTPELSRRARGVEVWAALRSLGRGGLADLIERNCRYARRFAEGLTRPATRCSTTWC